MTKLENSLRRLCEDADGGIERFVLNNKYTIRFGYVLLVVVLMISAAAFFAVVGDLVGAFCAPLLVLMVALVPGIFLFDVINRI